MFYICEKGKNFRKTEEEEKKAGGGGGGGGGGQSETRLNTSVYTAYMCVWTAL